MTEQESKLEICEVGPFRLPGVSVNLSQVPQEEFQKMCESAREHGGFVSEAGCFSWKDVKKRDWFLLQWS
jgi:hypothetical protein